MASFNKVILVGNLTADPELKKTRSGISVTSFAIGVSRRYAKAEEKPICDFFEIVAWRHHAEFVCRYFSKGNAILVEAQARTESYSDRNGNKRTKVVFVVDTVSFVERKYRAQGTPQDEFAPIASYMSDSDDFEELADSDELPF